MSTEETSQYGPGYFLFEEDVTIEFEHAIDHVYDALYGNVDERVIKRITDAMWEKCKELNKAFNKMEFKDISKEEIMKMNDINSKPTPLPRFSLSLVNFFNSLDMGTGPNEVRFQETSECDIFFKHGISRLTAGVSLFNVFANTYKLKNETKEVRLTPEQRAIIAPALEQMVSKYKEKNNLEDVANLENGILVNKYYMSILSFYRDSNLDETFEHSESYREKVNNMSKFLKETNENLTEKIRSKK
jgi:hypothetical protein